MPDMLSIPPRLLPDGKLAVVEQGTDEEIGQRADILCRTPPGWLDNRPDVGVRDDSFDTGGADLVELDRQVRGLGPDVYSRLIDDPSLMQDGLDALNLQVGAAQ